MIPWVTVAVAEVPGVGPLGGIVTVTGTPPIVVVNVPPERS